MGFSTALAGAFVAAARRAPPPPRAAALAFRRAATGSAAPVTVGAFVGRAPLTPAAATRRPLPSTRRAPAAPTMIRGGGDRGGGGGGGGDAVPVLERLGASAPYLLPLLDGLVFGRFVFERAPAVAAVVLPALSPLFRAYRGIPFFAFGIFFALYLLVVRNTGFSRFVRFNTQQALLLDVVLILPQLLGGAVASSGVPGWIIEAGSSTIFYAVVASVGYAVVSNAQGQVPDQIPAVSEAVEAQIGPY